VLLVGQCPECGAPGEPTLDLEKAPHFRPEDGELVFLPPHLEPLYALMETVAGDESGMDLWGSGAAALDYHGITGRDRDVAIRCWLAADRATRAVRSQRIEADAKSRERK
jgi:hypothetical protein